MLDPHLLVRAASVYLAVAATAAVLVRRRPSTLELTGALLACAWLVPSLLALNAVAPGLSWWHYEAEGGLLLGMPVDLFLAWMWIWGALPVMACGRVSLPFLATGALVLDVVAMPLATPVVQLGPYWLVGEAVALFTAFVPAQILARLTMRRTHLPARALLQVAAFSGLVVFVLPAIAISGSDGSWVSPLERPSWALNLWLQLLALPAVVGLSAVQEFVQRGGGTPVPYDPPERLVTSGLYAYVRSPMQLSAVVMLALLGLVLGNLWVSAAGIMAHIYSLGLAGWDEESDMVARHGAAWLTYRAAVPRWIPRARPWHDPASSPARLYVGQSCDMCRRVGLWFEARHASHLVILPAEAHPSGALRRITYEAGDGSYSASGVVAIARALEHLHLAWALAGAGMRLPGLASVLQLLVDASGGEPRLVTASETGSRPRPLGR